MTRGFHQAKRYNPLASLKEDPFLAGFACPRTPNPYPPGEKADLYRAGQREARAFPRPKGLDR